MVERTWNWWRNALKGEFGPITESPETGYYRLAVGRGGDFLPITYWYAGGDKLCCLHGARELDEDTARERWPFASKRPITREAYDFWKANGRWPDESEAAHEDRRNSQAAPDPNSFEALEDRIGDLIREAEQIVGKGAAANQETADVAADLAQRLNKLENTADQAREIEKKPSLEECRKIDARWRPLIDKAGDLKRRLKRLVIDPFLAAETRKRQADRAQAVAQGKPAAELPPRPVGAGTTGKRITQKTHASAEVTDYFALARHLIEHKHPGLIANLQTIADGAAKQGLALPGMTITKEKIAV